MSIDMHMALSHLEDHRHYIDDLRTVLAGAKMQFASQFGLTVAEPSCILDSARTLVAYTATLEGKYKNLLAIKTGLQNEVTRLQQLLNEERMRAQGLLNVVQAAMVFSRKNGECEDHILTQMNVLKLQLV